MDRSSAIQDFAVRHGFTGLRPLGRGLEFQVFRATTPGGAEVVLRTPAGARFESNLNDPRVDTRRLLRWEDTVARHLDGLGFPVAKAHSLFRGQPDVLVSEFVPDDGRGADQRRLGAVLRRLHRLPPPQQRPVAEEGTTVTELLPTRIVRRWTALADLVPGLPRPPAYTDMAAALANRPMNRLLHLDVRAANLRCVGGEVRGLLDWSNALIADPLLELARLAEFARLPDNELDLTEILAGYGTPEVPDSLAAWVYRLDAAVMLAVVFASEAPDAELGPRAVERLCEVHTGFRTRLNL